MSLRRFEVIEKNDDQIFATYIHGDSGSLGGVVVVGSDKGDPAVAEFAFNVALHVVAFRPLYLSTDRVDAAYRDEQEAIFKKQAESMDKPEKVIQGIAQGKLRKHMSEICLLEQGFVKDEKKAVKEVAKEVAKGVGGTVTVDGYRVFAVGEAL